MLLHPIDFWITVLTFSFVSRYFKIYSVTNLLFSSMLFSLHIFVLFLQFFAEISSLIWRGQKWYLLWFQFLKNYWDLFCGLTCALSWRMFNVTWKDYVFCWFWVEWSTFVISFYIICDLWPVFPYWYSVWMICPLMKVGC